jgi:hypothetical protein
VLACAALLGGAGATGLARGAAAATNCSPGPNQIALFTQINYGGTCANFSTGSYPLVTGTAGIPDNSAYSIKVGAGAVGVLHKNPTFGGSNDDNWQAFSANDPNLGNDFYQGTNTVVAGSVSSLWVLQTGCTPGPNQVAVFDLPSFGGGCALIGQGVYPSMPAAGVPADFVGSLKDGANASVTIYQNPAQGGKSCSYGAGVPAPTLCFGDGQASSITVTVLPPTTSATISLTKAVPGASSTEIAGGLSGLPNTTYTLAFYGDTTCGAETNLLGSSQVKVGAGGFATFDLAVGSAAAAGSLVSATATEPNHGASVPSACIAAGPDNTSWPSALAIPLDGSGNGSSTGTIDLSGEARWYKFAVAPGENLRIDLTNLPANYDLSVFSDIGQSFVSLNSPSDLQTLSSEFAPNAFSPNAFSPNAFSPNAFSPNAFSPNAFSPNAFSPNAFSTSAFSPNAFSPNAFSPNAFSNFTDTNHTYEAAQATSLIAYSAADGTANEEVVANTWNNTGVFYIRATGRNGTYVPGVPFSVSVDEDVSSCAGVVPSTAPLLSAPAAATGAKTLVLEDVGRMPGGAQSPLPSDLSTMQSKLQAFAQLPQVGGAIVDVGAQSPRVSALFAQADANTGCVYAENLVADAIHDVVTAYRAQSPGLTAVVVVGTDHAIPFFRYPDASGLGTESNYVPPVADNTASQASLRLDYVLSQDEYGAKTTVQLDGLQVPVPDLPVGRLVETPTEISGMLDAYMTGTTNGSVSPTSSLVTGYDFLAGSAQQVQDAFSSKLGPNAADSLISPEGTPLDQSWNADDLRGQLLGKSHGLIYLAGHFSADNTLAADYATTMDSSELAASAVNLKNSIVFSAGCHSGYNIVDGDAVPGVTQPTDWVQAFAQKGATVVAGTGYQYGDTDFLAYSAKLYASFGQDLVAGGTVAVGDALVEAKQQYLADTPQASGIDIKSVLEATLYGLPMLGVTTPTGTQTLVHGTAALGISPTPATTNPGAGLGLSSSDQDYAPTLTAQTKTLTDQSTGNPVTATYLQGPDGVVTALGAPVLPLFSTDVTVQGQVLRGVGFRGGTFTDAPGVTPLLAGPATDLSSTHAPFASSTFFPDRLWSVNYFQGLADGSTSTELMLMPAQYKSDAPGSSTDTQRAYSDVGLRLFYSANTSGAALAAPPSIARVDASISGGVVTFAVHVVGDPAAGIQGVWVTYRSLTGNTWQSLDLTQSSTDTTLWSGTLATSGPVEFMVQAVNGVGLVSLDTNGGAYYRPGQIPPALQSAGSLTATATTLGSFPTSAPYGSQATLSATLVSGGSPVAGKALTFTIGSSRRVAVTDATGTATVQLPLIDLPGIYTVTAAFAGDATLAASSKSVPFTITSLPTSLALGGGGTVIDGGDTGIKATLTTGGVPLPQRTIEFVLSQGAKQIVQTRFTDPSGVAALGTVPVTLNGTYTVQAYYGPGGPTPPTLAPDPVYTPSSASSVSLTAQQVSVSAITLAGTSPTNAASVSWNVTFTGPVSGVAKGNFSLAGSGTITGVSGSGSSYTVTASTGSDGPLGLNLSSTTGITDGVGGSLAGTFTGQAYTVDRTNPTITASAAPAPNAAGWNNSDVTVTFTCSDSGSGIATCPSPVTVGEGANQSVTRSATDKAGNSASATASPINVDETAPTVSYSGNSGTYTVDQTVVITCSASDALSGVAGSTCSNVNAPASSFALGTTTLNATATDRAGNTGSGSTSFKVVLTETSLDNLIRLFCGTDTTGANGLISKADNIVTATTPTAKAGAVSAFDNQVEAKVGNSLTRAQGNLLEQLAASL